ncbi:hypothetical protein ANCCAN_07524 [Ancylostoma caninum]|uniref:Uncharacterized protein n=1 Tax=Ancylostoma caninum TaxID=29170 RepID=A0A368GQ00_ANCCA|nr:hypothetical protein ANCCAN_07524 [Ancylostoma caninum]
MKTSRHKAELKGRSLEHTQSEKDVKSVVEKVIFFSQGKFIHTLIMKHNRDSIFLVIIL